MSKREGLPPTPDYFGAPNPKKIKVGGIELDDDENMDVAELEEIIPIAGPSGLSCRSPCVSPDTTIVYPGPSGISYKTPTVSPVPSELLASPSSSYAGPSGITYNTPCVSPVSSEYYFGVAGPSGLGCKTPNVSPKPSCTSYKSQSVSPAPSEAGPSGVHSSSYFGSAEPSEANSAVLIVHPPPRTHRSRAEDRPVRTPPLMTDVSQLGAYDTSFDDTGIPLGPSDSTESMDIDEPTLRRVESSSSIERESKSNRLDWTGSRM